MSTPWVLSSDEMALVQNAQWLLTKQLVIEKVYRLFGELSTGYAALLQQLPPADAAFTLPSPKIARGEYYRQLPYVMLDHPRFFQQEDAFAIRSFFWWGNSFSIHLHLSGIPKVTYLPRLLQHLQSGRLQEWYTVLQEDRWQHYFGPGNYVAVNSVPAAAVQTAWQQQPFIKLAQPLPLQHWEEAYAFYMRTFEELLLLLKA